MCVCLGLVNDKSSWTFFFKITMSWARALTVCLPRCGCNCLEPYQELPRHRRNSDESVDADDDHDTARCVDDHDPARCLSLSSCARLMRCEGCASVTSMPGPHSGGVRSRTFSPQTSCPDSVRAAHILRLARSCAVVYEFCRGRTSGAVAFACSLCDMHSSLLRATAQARWQIKCELCSTNRCHHRKLPPLNIILSSSVSCFHTCICMSGSILHY